MWELTCGQVGSRHVWKSWTNIEWGELRHFCKSLLLCFEVKMWPDLWKRVHYGEYGLSLLSLCTRRQHWCGPCFRKIHVNKVPGCGRAILRQSIFKNFPKLKWPSSKALKIQCYHPTLEEVVFFPHKFKKKLGKCVRRKNPSSNIASDLRPFLLSSYKGLEVDPQHFTTVGEIHRECAWRKKKKTAEKRPLFFSFSYFPMERRGNREMMETAKTSPILSSH